MFRLNRIIALSVGISTLFLLSACNQETKQQPVVKQQEVQSKFKFESVSEPSTIPKQNADSVLAPVDTQNFTYLNGLKIENNMFDKDKGIDLSKGSFHYAKISGLVNKEIENKINQKIYDEYIALYNKGLPPYRGIRSVATDDKDIKFSVMYVSTSSLGNILSVNISKQITIESGDKKKYDFINDTSTLNFNLRNGELIPLSDLFADNCDYKKIVNDQINKYIFSQNLDDGDKGKANDYEMGMGRLQIVSPFNGIKDNQKYYIAGEDIHIVIDYNLPEFDTNYTSSSIRIESKNPEVAKNIALFTRFETNDESLYDKSTKRQKNLRNLNFDTKEERIMYGKAQDLGLSYKDIEVNLYLQAPKQFANKELETSFNKKYNEAKSKFIALIKDKKGQYPNNRMMVSYNYYVREMGKYLTEEEHAWVHIDINEGKEFKSFNTSDMAVYDSKTGKKISLDECFKNGFDYKKAMYNIIHKNNYNKLTDDEIKKLIETNNFMINSHGIDISDVQSKDGKDKNSYHISFADLGYENLTVFD